MLGRGACPPCTAQGPRLLCQTALGVAALLELDFNSCLHCKVRKTNFSLERISNVDTRVIVYFCFFSFPSCSVSVI